MSQLSFNPKLGMVSPDSASIRAEIAATWVNSFAEEGKPSLDVEPTTPAGQIVDSEAAFRQATNSALVYLSNMFNPLVNEGKWQDAIGYIYFLERQTELPTVVVCQCAGLQGTVIPEGAEIRDDENNRYLSLATQEITAQGFVDVPFANVEFGPIAAPADTVNKIVTIIPGWDTVNNSADGVMGRREESRADFEKRRFLSVAANAHGSREALEGFLGQIDNVVDIRVLENVATEPAIKWGITVGGHSVACCIFGGTDADIAEGIYLKKSMGTGTSGNTQIKYVSESAFDAEYIYNIVRPAPTPIYINVVMRKTPDTSLTYEQDIKNAILSDFIGENLDSDNVRVGLAQTLYASRFSVAIIKTAGISDLISVTVKKSEDGDFVNFIDIMGNEEPTLAAEDIIIEALDTVNTVGA